MKIAVVGCGFVGKAMIKLFKGAVVNSGVNYDPAKDLATREQVNACDVAFVCVPTEMLDNGECDTSIVEETVKWLETPLIIIRSTVKPGTTLKLIQETGKNIIFQPEYVGETTAHPLLNESERTFLIFGGTLENSGRALEVYKTVYNSSVQTLFVSPTEAEVIKYMENTAIGTMVTLCNEFYNICQALGADYNIVREGFLMDPRMSRYFTFVYPEARGFSGKCLPKDLNAIAAASLAAGYQAQFIEHVLYNNNKFNKQSI
jgi:UDPglucose 6-dehydrogenase